MLAQISAPVQDSLCFLPEIGKTTTLAGDDQNIQASGIGTFGWVEGVKIEELVNWRDLADLTVSLVVKESTLKSYILHCQNQAQIF